ncbi:MAG: helix-turn-helix transcriptional regulator [Oscillospiraceae bacterium]|nr:helix-turn-helix transcriptional regulator [Oscillospiraceae bacterium]
MKEKKPINIEVGQRIKERREAAGLTQETLAEMVGLGVKHISAIERGAIGVSLPTLKRVCSVLSVSADDLLFDPPDAAAQSEQERTIHQVSKRLSRLPANELKVMKELLDKAFEAMAVAKEDQKAQ